MKIIKISLLPVLLSMFLLSCHGHRPVTTIESSNDNNYIKIKYNGTISFTPDSTGIEGLSPESTLSYENNNDYILVNSNEKGQLSFEMTEDGKTLLMDQKGKEFIAKAVKVMIAQGAGRRK